MSWGWASESWGDRAAENSCSGSEPVGRGAVLGATRDYGEQRRAKGPVASWSMGEGEGGGKERQEGVVNTRELGDRTKECHTLKLRYVDLTQKGRNES